MARTDDLARRQGTLDALRAWRCGRKPARRRRCPQGRTEPRRERVQEGHARHLQGVGRHFQERDRVRFRQARAPLSRTGLPQFGRADPAARQAPRGNARARPLLRGRDRGLRQISRPQQAAAGRRTDRGERGKGRHRHRCFARVERQLLRERPYLHQQHSAARWRHAPRRVPHRADAHAEQLRQRQRDAEEREGLAVGRRHARRPDRDRFGQAARPQVLLADQGQAGQLRSAFAAGKPDGREDERMAGGKPRRSQGDHPEGDRRRRRARSRAPRARDEPQGRDEHRLAAGQAGRLPGPQPRELRTLPGRGRLGRGQRQAGPRPQDAGDPAAQGQDPQCRACALRPDHFLEGSGHADPGDGHRAARRIRSREAALSQDRDHDRRRCRRRAYPHPAAHLLPPADARDRQGRAPLHRAAAAVQGLAREERSLSQGPAGLRSLPDRAGPRCARARNARRRRGARRRRA